MAKTPKNSGFFVVFEGPDGSGKSTQAKLLADKLTAQGLDVLLTKEPGGTAIGQKIREILLNPDNTGLDKKAELLLFAADRAQHITEVIAPALKSGKIVISDRFAESTKTYQLARGNALLDILSVIRTPITPDLTIFLDIDYKTKRARRPEGRELDRFEQEKKDFFEKVRKYYKHSYKVANLVQPLKVAWLDTTTATPEEIAEQVFYKFCQVSS